MALVTWEFDKAWGLGFQFPLSSASLTGSNYLCNALMLNNDAVMHAAFSRTGASCYLAGAADCLVHTWAQSLGPAPATPTKQRPPSLPACQPAGPFPLGREEALLPPFPAASSLPLLCSLPLTALPPTGGFFLRQKSRKPPPTLPLPTIFSRA